MIDILVFPDLVSIGEKRMKVYETCVMIEARKWAQLGHIIQFNFCGVSWRFTDAQVIEALKYLHVEFEKIPKQTKWFEFWRDDKKLRLLAAIELVKCDKPNSWRDFIK